jgi:soluble lytic murein transglycosylase-like protein
VTPVLAGEYAVLRSGARLYCARHEAAEGKLKLIDKSGGFTELQEQMVAGFEIEEAAPAPAAPPAAPPVVPPVAAPLDPLQLADAAADKYGLPRALVRSVMKAESGFQPHVVSPKGAIGLMQLMPGTAEQLGVDPHDPVQNVDAGTRYLRDLLVRYDSGLFHALAAYNAGPAAVDRYNGVPPYRETIGYIRRIVKDSGLAQGQ